VTVATLVSSDSWVSAGTLAPRSIAFPFIDPDDVRVTYKPVVGAVQSLVRGTHYTITGNGQAGTAVFTPLVVFAAGGAFRIERVTRALQEYETERSTPLDADSVERELDRQSMRNIEQDRDAAALKLRTPLALEGQTAPAFDVTGLTEDDLLIYKGGQIKRWDTSGFEGQFVAGGPGGRFVPSSGLGGGDLSLRGDLANLFGSDLIGFDPTLDYNPETIGYYLKPLFSEANAKLLCTTQSGADIQVGLQVRHYANAVGSAGVDIRQYPGAAPGFILHCYSNINPADLLGAVAAQIDHIGNGSILVLKNAFNANYPGTSGKANFLSFVGFGGSPQTTAKELGTLTHQLVWLSYDELFPFTFNGGLAAVAGTGHAQAIKSTSLLDSLYAGEFYGRQRGVFISTITNDGFSFAVIKNASGGGTVAFLANNGTGSTLVLTNGVYAQVAAFSAAGWLSIGSTAALAPLDVTGNAIIRGNIRLTATATSGGENTLVLGATTQATIGGAGSASALPANPLGYLQAYIGTTPVAIPYYNV